MAVISSVTASVSRGPARLPAAAGVALLLLGLLVAGGWFFHIPFFVRVSPGFAPMPFDGALGFATAGIALICLSQGCRRTASGCGLLLFLLGAATLVEYLAGIDLGFDRFGPDPSAFILSAHPGRLAPGGAICFVLVGTGLLAEGRGRGRHLAVWLATSLLVAISGMALFGYAVGLEETYAWGQWSRIPLHGAAGFFIFGVGLTAFAVGREGWMEAPWLPLPVGMAIGIAVMILWHALLASGDRQVRFGIMSDAAHLQAALTYRINARVQGLERMQYRLAARPGMPREEWQSDADLTASQEKVYQVIERAGPDRRVRWIAPVAGNEGEIGLALDRDPRRREAVEKAVRENVPVLSRTVPLAQGGKGFVAYLPVYPAPGKPLAGMVAAVFRLDSLFDPILMQDGFSECAVTVYDGEEEVYRHGIRGPAENRWRQAISVSIDGASWRVEVEPTPAFLAHKSSRLPHLILFLGLALSVVGALAVTALQRARLRAVEAAEANLALERRVEERTIALRRSEENFRFLADVIPHFVWAARPDGGLTYVNRYAIDYTGLDLGEQRERGWEKLIHPDDLPAVLACARRAGQEGTPYDIEERLRRHDGAYRWHLARIFPQKDENGTVERWIGACTDIHDQKAARSVLEELVARRTADLTASEEHFRQAFDYAGIGMALVGPDGGWLRVNRALCGIIGYTSEELLRKTFQEITHPDDLDADLGHVRELLDGKEQTYRMQKRYFHKDGHVVWVRLTVSLVRDARERPQHFVSQIEDITERIEAQERLVRQNAALEIETARAQEASRLKSEFLSNMSHELRTPLNGIIGFSEFIHDQKAGPLNDQQVEFLGDVLGSARHLLHLINDILDLAKIEAGRMELFPEPFSLETAVASVCAVLEPLVRQKRLSLSTSIEVAPSRVVLDAAKFKQILYNLLSNAVKFTPDGGKVEVAVRTRPADPGSFELVVRDTGIGIKQDDFQRLFGEFQQLDSGPSRRYQGTGLGLALTRKLVMLHGGTIGVESVFGEGSTFTVVLPRAVSAQTPS